MEERLEEDEVSCEVKKKRNGRVFLFFKNIFLMASRSPLQSVWAVLFSEGY